MNRLTSSGPSRLDVIGDQLSSVVEILEQHQRRHDAVEERLTAQQPAARDDGARLDAIERHLGSIATLLAQLLAQRSASPETADELFARLETDASARNR